MSEQIIIGHSPSGQPVFAEVLSPEEIRDRMLESPEWKTFSERFDMSDAGNVTLLNAVFGDKLGSDAELADYTQLLSRITSAGGVVLLDGSQFEFVMNSPEEIVEEPEVPTDRNGKPLTQAQILWSEFRQFAESHSSTECRQRAQSDARFAAFMRTNLRREMESGVGDAVQNLNERPEAVEGEVTDELKAWVEEYHRTPTSRVKQLRLASFNPLGYKDYSAKFQAASNAGLI